MQDQTIVNTRVAPINVPNEEFRRAGHLLVDEIAGLLSSLDNSQRPVAASGQSPKLVRSLLAPFEELPSGGTPIEQLVRESTRLILEHSLYNGHPKFFGYITSSPSPVGILSDFLASAVNPNVGAWVLSPVATEMELQSIRWIAEMLGYPKSAGGILVDGGNMANFVCFLAARKAKTSWDIRKLGTGQQTGQPRIYTSAETHTWIQKAADLFGLGTDSIRWITTDDDQKMDSIQLEKRIVEDRQAGDVPMMIVGTAGSTATGAIDPLGELSRLCTKYDIWFHVDAAYGGFAALAPGVSEDLRFMSEADSVAVDPHKWLYAPLEAGCSLVKNPKHLLDAFSYHPSYYRFDSDPGDFALNLFDYGPQNSRGFRALKVWMSIRQVGSDGYARMIGDDIALAERLFQDASKSPSLEACTRSLSIATFRFVPPDLRKSIGSKETEVYLNKLNEELLARLQSSGEAFLSNAVLKNNKFVLRACVVNFRTSAKDVHELSSIVIKFGEIIDGEMRRGRAP
jgi:aromatic-L-amino-acid/L-tryptophan decarboxylase